MEGVKNHCLDDVTYSQGLTSQDGGGDGEAYIWILLLETLYDAYMKYWPGPGRGG